MGVTAEELQMLRDGSLDFRIAGQGATILESQSFGGLSLGQAEILNALFDDDACGFLRDESARTIVHSYLLFAHLRIPG